MIEIWSGKRPLQNELAAARGQHQHILLFIEQHQRLNLAAVVAAAAAGGRHVIQRASE